MVNVFLVNLSFSFHDKIDEHHHTIANDDGVALKSTQAIE